MPFQGLKLFPILAIEILVIFQRVALFTYLCLPLRFLWIFIDCSLYLLLISLLILLYIRVFLFIFFYSLCSFYSFHVLGLGLLFANYFCQRSWVGIYQGFTLRMNIKFSENKIVSVPLTSGFTHLINHSVILTFMFLLTSQLHLI